MPGPTACSACRPPCATLEEPQPPSSRSDTPVTVVIIAMLLVLVLCAAVVTYVAFPHRGADVPGAPWLSDAMRKGVDRLPTLDEEHHHV